MGNTKLTLFIYILLSTVPILLTGCTSPQPDNGATKSSGITAKGKIKPSGMTSFMYGSHLLYDDEGQLSYALTSDEIDLKQYEGMRVEINGEAVEGYPVDNGPPYLRVKSIKTTGIE